MRSVTSISFTSSRLSTTWTTWSQWSRSEQSTVISRSVLSSPWTRMSIAPIWPPASPIAEVSRPSDPGRRRSSSRRMIENCALCDSEAIQPDHKITRVASRTANRELFLIDGNSLVYRAFFALPETIATSTGQPTNAIFGFASMLVKILTEYGSQPTLVAWDAGMSGREEVSTEYKAGRRKRPDLLRGAVAAPAPAGRGVRLPERARSTGYEADDVIATLARQAREKDIDVMVVTGDRDMFQIVGEGVRVMATSRGITETKLYDRQARDRPLRDPAGADPRLLRAEGRHLGQHPGRPGHRRQDGFRPAPALRRPRDGPRLDRRDLGREAQGEPDQPRRRRAHVEGARDDPDRTCRSRSTWRSATPPSPTARRSARRSAIFELRDPLRRLEEALGRGRGGARRRRPRRRSRCAPCKVAPGRACRSSTASSPRSRPSGRSRRSRPRASCCPPSRRGAAAVRRVRGRAT